MQGQTSGVEQMRTIMDTIQMQNVGSMGDIALVDPGFRRNQLMPSNWRCFAADLRAKLTRRRPQTKKLAHRFRATGNQ